jgi:KDO2-lipid IV(A) lauroyltransferase
MGRNQGKRIEFYLMPLASWLQNFIPRRLALGIGRLLIRLMFPFLKRQRRVIAVNFRYILGRELQPGEGDAIAGRVLRNQAMCTTDLLRAPQLCRRRKLDRVVPFPDHRPELDKALAGGRSVILVTGHLGNWDLAGVLIAHDNYPIVAVYERITRGMSDIFNRFRGTSGMELIGMDDREAMNRAIESGKLFVLVGDRDLKGNGIELPWFSGRRTFPRGAAAFSLRYNVPILIGYMIMVPDDPQHRYRAVAEPPVEFLPSGDFPADVDALTAAMVRRLERVVAQYPEQWFVYQPRWIGGNEENATTKSPDSI